jgi:hypothetical protein
MAEYEIVNNKSNDFSAQLCGDKPPIFFKTLDRVPAIRFGEVD